MVEQDTLRVKEEDEPSTTRTCVVLDTRGGQLERNVSIYVSLNLSTASKEHNFGIIKESLNNDLYAALI